MTLKLSGGLLAGVLLPGIVHACACGCSVFDVGTSAMFPSGPGGMFFLQYDYQNQNRNWSGSSTAPPANNGDKQLETHFVELGAQYFFNRSWGAQVEVPYTFRYFKADDGTGNVISRRWNQLGDIRFEGIYSGFFDDMRAGVSLGVKLPTGSFRRAADLADRDTQIGTGSTDLLLGGFYHDDLTTDGKWGWFGQANLDLPVLIQDQYRPGIEVDTAAGIDYKGLSIGRLKIVPIAQVIFSERTSDSGANSANPVATGYQRVLLSPGIEFRIHPVRIYADAEFPVYQHFTGNQLAAPVLFKASISWMF